MSARITAMLGVLAGLASCHDDAEWYEYRWAFNCADGTYFICRDEGYFHCDGAPPTYEPGPSCTLVSATCTSNPRPGQSEAQAACGPSCAGTVTCDRAPPTCGAGEVPLVAAGCYSGACEPVTACDVSPPCAAINDEPDCLARTDCSAFYEGIDCTNPSGTACRTGDPSCTCAGFEFSSCEPR